ncbi:MAG: hypothetical protein R3263_09955 [Myxococcota bacterium]|nr:hypothetical protein [Myxococcota bacterium]
MACSALPAPTSRRARHAEAREFAAILARGARRERTARRVAVVAAGLALAGVALGAARGLGLAILAAAGAFGAEGVLAWLGLLAGGGAAATAAAGAVLLLAAAGLRRHRPWARGLAVAVCALALLLVPVGTLLGGAALLVLLAPDTARLFGA